jgi:hypothetical protein
LPTIQGTAYDLIGGKDAEHLSTHIATSQNAVHPKFAE